MDSNLLLALVASVTTAGSTAGVAITAQVISNKRIDRVEASLDQLSERQKRSLIDWKPSSIDCNPKWTPSLIGKRLGIVEDRIFNRGVSGD